MLGSFYTATESSLFVTTHAPAPLGARENFCTVDFFFFFKDVTGSVGSEKLCESF